MKDESYMIRTFEQEAEQATRRTFRVWELTAVYRFLGLEPREAIAAAVADLRMFPICDFCVLQEEAA
jgi:hypothetical protein